MSHCPFPVPGFPPTHRGVRCWGEGDGWVRKEEKVALLPLCNSSQFLVKFVSSSLSLFFSLSFFSCASISMLLLPCLEVDPEQEIYSNYTSPSSSFHSCPLYFFWLPVLDENIKNKKRAFCVIAFHRGTENTFLRGNIAWLFVSESELNREKVLAKGGQKRNGGSWFSSPRTPIFHFAAQVAILRGKPDCLLSYLKPLRGWS